MTTNSMDWSKLPSQDNPTRLFFKMLIPDRMDTLKRVHSAISIWRDIADRELEDFRLDVKDKWNDAWDEHGYDPVSDEAFTLAKCEHALWGSFAVSVSATIEGSLMEICTARNLTLPEKPFWGHMKTAVEQSLGVDMSTFAGFTDVDRVRIVANCFKHNGSKANDEYSSKYQCEKNSEIELEKEDWQQHIQSTHDFLTAVSKRL